MFMNFHNVNRNNFRIFDNPVCSYSAGARAMQQLQVVILRAGFGAGLVRGTSAGGSAPSPCPGLLQQPFLQPVLPRRTIVLRWQNANYPGDKRVCVAVL